MKKTLLQALMFGLFVMVGISFAQNFGGVPGAVPVQGTTPYYSQIPISATAAVNVVTTLTIPAPTTGLYNYVCYIALNASQDGTGTALANAVTSTTNFNSFATKFSNVQSARANYDWFMYFGNPATGCAKSASPATATTFVSPQSANTAYTWYATYYQAP